jgi:hypothetical protein
MRKKIGEEMNPSLVSLQGVANKYGELMAKKHLEDLLEVFLCEIFKNKEGRLEVELEAIKGLGVPFIMSLVKACDMQGIELVFLDEMADTKLEVNFGGSATYASRVQTLTWCMQQYIDNGSMSSSCEAMIFP